MQLVDVLQNRLLGNLGLGASCAIQLEFHTGKQVASTGQPGEHEPTRLFTNKNTVAGEVGFALCIVCNWGPTAFILHFSL